MPKDAIVQSTIAHWAPRFVTNGVLLSDFQEVTARIECWDQWCAAWSGKALEIENLGRAALAEGLWVSAAELLSKASVYYHFGKFVFVNDLAQMRAAHQKAVDCRMLALPYLSPGGVRVEIPFEASHLAGVLRKPSGAGRPPVVILVPGLDSTKEELDGQESVFLARGMATLSVDGPGQGEAEYEFPLRHDYEAPLSAVIDFLEKRADIDARCVGVYGVSLGGYFATRAAAFEPRIRATVANGGPYEFASGWEGIPELSREAMRVRSHSATAAQAREKLSRFNLQGVAEKVKSPIFVLNGTVDRLVSFEDAKRVAGEVQGPVELLLVEGGNHCAMNKPYCWRPQTADWMARQLAPA